MARVSILNIMNSMVPISRFNKGEASKIFDEVESSGYKDRGQEQPACMCTALAGAIRIFDGDAFGLSPLY